MSDDLDCAVKHCDQPATLGMVVVLAGLRVELFLCELHFDVLDATPLGAHGRRRLWGHMVGAAWYLRENAAPTPEG